MKKFKIAFLVARAEAAQVWDAEFALTLFADTEEQAMMRAEIVLGPYWPKSLPVRLLRVTEVIG
jgi:hypothetical protein